MNASDPKTMSGYQVDLYRRELAETGKTAEWLATYNGRYPEMDLSTKEKWDGLLVVKKAPRVRLDRLERVVERIDASGRLLDVGVGWGDIVPILLRKNPRADYTGIDFSDKAIEKLKKDYPALRFRKASVEEIDGPFDTALVLEVMEHIPPSQIFGFLANVNRVLKPGGALMITVPFEEDLSTAVNRMGHVRSYSEKLILAELKQAGFRPVGSEIMYGRRIYNGPVGPLVRGLRNAWRRILNRGEYRPLQPAILIIELKKV